MEWNDDSTMCFRWVTDCTNPLDDYAVFMINFRSHFDYKIGWLFLYVRINNKNVELKPVPHPSKSMKGYLEQVETLFSATIPPYLSRRWARVSDGSSPNCRLYINAKWPICQNPQRLAISATLPCRKAVEQSS